MGNDGFIPVSMVIQYFVGKFENSIHMMAKIKIMTREGIYRLPTSLRKWGANGFWKLTKEELDRFPSQSESEQPHSESVKQMCV